MDRSQALIQESEDNGSNRSNLNVLPDNSIISKPLKSDLEYNAEQLKSEGVLEDTAKSHSELEHLITQPNAGSSNSLDRIDSQHEVFQFMNNEVADVTSTIPQQHLTPPIFAETHNSDEFEQFEDDMYLGSSENLGEDQLHIVQHPDDGEESDYMVRSINTNSGSEHSLNMGDDSSVTIITEDDVHTPPSPSQGSVASIESSPIGDASGSYVFADPSPSASLHEGTEAEGSTLYSSGDSQSQILAPSINNDEYEEDDDRIRLTPIISRGDSGDVPPSPTISSISGQSERAPSLLHSNIIPDILLRHPQINRNNNNLDLSALTFIHQQMLIPFFHGFSWAFGMHLYRYLRYGFSFRELWWSLFAGITGRNGSNA
ncbi:11617_t:CDS:1 [Acaulospora colombiana]|uniref:11617_t:CDS:1 n=1 Tax=Acaulospora colombiana TaxID=27376 RepID=A0ACA9MTM5_9GLOM|nr:11617_t:CDS:1 [Acaulospora colombiana]